MKKTIFTLVFVVFLLTAAMPQNIPNRGFEAWDTLELYEEPASWITSNAIALIKSDSLLLVRKTEDAVSGSYALYMESGVAGDDTVAAFTFCQGFVAGDYPDLRFLGGFPFTGEPDSLTGYFKYDLPEEDTARILVIFKKEGQVLAESWFSLYGQQTTYRRISFALPDLPEAPDTVFLGLAATTPWAPLPGGHLYVDALAFDQGGDIPNGDFEEWTMLTYTDPAGWSSGNAISAVTHSERMCEPTTDAHSGDYALKMETVYLNILDDNAGVITTGQIGVNTLSGGFPVQAAPTVIQGYYKYQPVGSDQGQLLVICSKWDDEQGTRDQQMRFFALPAANEYTFFSDTLHLGDMEVDTVNIVVASGWLLGAENAPPAGSVLYLDDLWLVNPCDYADTTRLFPFRDTTFCEGDSIILDAGAGYTSYLWSDSSTTQTLTVSESGYYGVTVTTGGGCKITDGVTVHVDACTERKDVPKDEVLRIYPNPFGERFFVRLPEGTEGRVRVTVANVLGQKVHEVEAEAGAYDRLQVDMSGKAEGIYFVRIRWNEGEKVLKVIKR